MLLLLTRVVAQDRASDLAGKITDESTPAGPVASVSAQAVSLPQARAPQRVIDKKFIFTMSVLGAAETVRFTSRKLVLDNEFAAGAPWVAHVPANSNLVAKYSALYAAELLAAYEMKKSHSWLPGDRIIRKFWWAYPAAMSFIHIKNGIGNIRMQGPQGCTSLECAEQM